MDLGDPMRPFTTTASLAGLAGMLLASALIVAAPARADRKTRSNDRFWTAPELSELPVSSIALLPVVTFDGNLEARRITELSIGQALRGSGHRWVSANTAREYLRRAGGDSLANSIQTSVLERERVDSLQAPTVCAAARTRAVLTVRVDQWEQRKLEFNQSGTPTTTIKLRAALVDSTGRLLWSASGSETMEGPYQDASANTIGVKASGLNNVPLTNQGGAPTFQETLTKLLSRWSPEFPKKAAAPPPE